MGGRYPYFYGPEGRLVLVDSAFAFELPDVSAGWINAFDIETGESRLMSRREMRGLASRVRAWQPAGDGRQK